MTAQILDGKALGSAIQNEVREHIAKLGLQPGLAVLLAGADPASELYVSLKQRACRAVGIMANIYRFEKSAKEEELLNAIHWLNADNEIHAILIQLPLPEHLDEHKIISAMSSEKDVDGFHPENIKKLLAGEADITPGLHLGIMQLLGETKEPMAGKHAAIVAKSPEFTQTLAYVLDAFGITNETVAPEAKEAPTVIGQADIIIVAAGKPKFITGDSIKKGAIIIDVGTTRLSNGTVAGDVDFESCKEKASWITPVPGGVGPMTVAMLLKNTVLLANKRA